MTDWLIDTTFYTGLLIAAVLLLRRPVARAFGPQIAYALWALPALRLLLPPLVLPACFASWFASAPEVEPLAPTSGLVDPASAAEPVASAPVAASPLAPEPLIALSWSDILVSLWLGGAALFLVWRVVTYRQMRRVVLAEARPVGEVGAILLVETPAVGAPVAFGVRDKVVALPPLFMAQPDREARDLAIAHELAHHRGHDLLANFAAQAVLALHWFNPIAWLGWRAMRRDQEAACDARVIAGRGRNERALYAALIAGTAAGPRLALAAPMACPVLGEASIIHRLRSLSRSDLSARRRWAGRALLAGSALALPLSASITYAADERRRDPVAAPVPPAPAAPPVASLAPPAPPAVPHVAHAPDAPQPPEAPLPPEPPVPPRAPDARHAAQEHARHAAEIRRHAAVVRRHAEEAGREAHIARMQMREFDPKEFARLQRDTARLGVEAERMVREAEKMTRGLEQNIERTVAHALAESGAAHAIAERATAHATAERATAHAMADSRAHATVTRHIAAGLNNDRSLIACASARAGAQHEARCEEQALARSREAIRAARGSIAADASMPEEVRRDILKDLDAELADLGETS